MNLAVADLCVGFFGEPIIALLYWLPWRYDRAYMPLCLGIEASCFAMIALTIERFIVIEFPIHHVQLLTRDRLKIGIACSWLLSLFIALLPLFGKISFRTYTMFLYDGLGITFWVVLLGLYVRMFVVMHQYNRCLLEMQERDIQQGQSFAAARTREKEVTKAIFMFFGVFALCWTPPMVVANIGYFDCRPEGGSTIAERICASSGLLISAVNPLLYGLRMRQFRRAVVQMFSGCCLRGRDMYPLISWHKQPMWCD